MSGITDFMEGHLNVPGPGGMPNANSGSQLFNHSLDSSDDIDLGFII